MQFVTHHSTRKAVFWLLVLAMALVQFNGHLHRIGHSDLNQAGLAWAGGASNESPNAHTGEADSPESGLAHFHECALLDAVSLGFAPIAQPPQTTLADTNNRDEAPVYRPSAVKVFQANPPPARAPPVHV